MNPFYLENNIEKNEFQKCNGNINQIWKTVKRQTVTENKKQPEKIIDQHIKTYFESHPDTIDSILDYHCGS